MVFEMTYFSVIIPVFNKEPHVKRAIDSVLSQSVDSFELIIVCDPSTDKSNEIVNNFKDPRIRVYSRNYPGPGGYAARNLGIHKSNFDWLVFLDADDEWLPNHLERLSFMICGNPGVSVFSSSWVVREKGKNILDKFSIKNKKIDCVVLSLYEYLLNEVNGRRPVWTSVVCIKKETLISAGLFPEGKASMGGDIDTWLRCIYLSKYIVWYNNIGAIYHRDSVNMVTRNNYLDPFIHKDTTDKIINLVQDREVNILLKKRFNNIAVTAWNNNERRGEWNFNILNEVYFSVIGFKAFFCIFLSKFPVFFRRKIHRFATFCVFWFRKFLD